MNKYEQTLKLHYNKYLYKLETRLSIAHILRTEIQHGKNFQYARKELAVYKALLKPNAEHFEVVRRFGNMFTNVHKSEIVDAERIITNLLHEQDYTIRIEQSFLNIYSNNEQLIDKLASTLTTSYIKVWKPPAKAIEYLKNNKNIIIVNEPTDFEFKVTFGSKNVNPELANWIKKNHNLCKCGPKLLKKIAHSNWIKGQYVYIKNEKSLTLFELLANGNISRIDKIVCIEDLDK